MALPPVEKTPVLLMRFTPKASKEVIAGVLKALTRGGIIIIDSEGLYDEHGKIIGGGNNGNNSAVVLGLTTTQKLLEHEAEITRLVKPCRTEHIHIPTIMEKFSSNAREDFINIQGKNHDDYDADGLFTSSERALLVDSMINAIPDPESLDGDKERSSSPSLMCEAYQKLTGSAVGRAVEKLRSSTHKLKNSFSFSHEDYGNKTSTLCQALFESEYVDVISPIHISHIKQKIGKDTYSIMSPLPLQAIRDYYGEEVAFYFAWMDYMTKWLAIPGIWSLVVYCLRKYRGDTLDTCELTPFLGPLTFCWAVIANRHWERRESELAYKWGTFAVTNGDKISLGKRPGYRGKMRPSPITGRFERYCPPSKRRFKCVISFIITLFLLGGACGVMVISMNLQGYVSRADRELWGEEDHPLYFPFFSQLAEEGAIFDPNSVWKSFLPVILRAIIVTNINQQYSKLAVKLTEWENWETVLGHKNSLILKRVLFEAFDAYVVLFYLAVYERDIYSLRLELVGAFNVDTLRRVFTECIMPYLIRYFTKDKVGLSKKDDDLKDDENSGYLTSEADLEEYDIFDDYIEMLIQFGYITLFASAYPLAAFLAIGANLIEIRSDVWKLTHVCRRSSIVRAPDIGMYKQCLKVIAWLSAVSNLYLFAFTSSNLAQFFPDYYITNEVTGRPVPSASAAHEIILIVLVIEHCLIVIAVMMRNAVSSTARSVSVEVEKQQWHHENLAANARAHTLKRNSSEVTTLSEAMKRPALRRTSSAVSDGRTLSRSTMPF